MADHDRNDLARQRAAKAVNQGQDANLRTPPSAVPTGASRPGPTPGTARREGRGFVDSFGHGRVCTATGCTTRLSKYNGRDVCGLHDAPSRH